MVNGPHENIKPHHNNMLNAVNILLFVFIVLLEKYYVYTMIFYILLWSFHFEAKQNVKQNRTCCQHEISSPIHRSIWVRIVVPKKKKKK